VVVSSPSTEIDPQLKILYKILIVGQSCQKKGDGAEPCAADIICTQAIISLLPTKNNNNK
jgi:hypothetical protein